MISDYLYSDNNNKTVRLFQWSRTKNLCNNIKITKEKDKKKNNNIWEK